MLPAPLLRRASLESGGGRTAAGRGVGERRLAVLLDDHARTKRCRAEEALGGQQLGAAAEAEPTVRGAAEASAAGAQPLHMLALPAPQAATPATSNATASSGGTPQASRNAARSNVDGAAMATPPSGAFGVFGEVD